ncbi:ATP-binding sensor histidine kinase [Oscillatoria sp. FACHB-1406]|uniref:ATP-binding sensor histidine kinase n=1 Tax=Oscillatoria sp. FACHB-1406 TaxID=2692846 RepID=UPI0016845EBB|nr:ATP-binding sensor histidine kinase [Oscillatoria sp. FACHB-1406]MBD2579402.1 AAA family ATPase [Oscillatoria sp. FACHB-1406]
MTASISEIPLPNLSGYRIIEQLYAGSRTLVYRAEQLATQRSVILKILRAAYPSFQELLQFRNQYTLTKNLPIPGIIRPLSLESGQNGYILVMEDTGSISLAQYIHQQPLSLSSQLDIALQIAEIVQQLHAERIIHKDIKPANILIKPETGQIQLIDFSLSSNLPKQTQQIQNPNVLEGTLAYISPEQTGRMNRGVDYRSDFYSLGVTLYQLLSGQLPFQSPEALELVHAHIAQSPVAPHEINPSIPPQLSHIVLKLLAKNAEDRYQSALGLKYDLEQCQKQWQENQSINEFELGKRDVCERFIIPEKLYGREAEVKRLLEAFERVAAGASEVMLVAGYSGIGKTAAINEIHKPIVREKGYFIKGKFDQLNRNIPFSAFVQAFRDLIRQLLSESDAQLWEWKTKILNAVGESGGVIVEVIPELERIIGKQPEVTELTGSAAQNRFNLFFQKFVKVFTSVEHPLVIFIDDLQWADGASLKLLELLMKDTEYLLILGAYRDNEVSPVHPLTFTLDELNKVGVTIDKITLLPLALSHINQLVAATLKCSCEIAKPLTQVIYQKTLGNPFFTTQLLKALYDDDFIKFDINAGYWQCDLVRVKLHILTDDIVEFMSIQLQKLPAETQDVLKLAACIGAQFELQTLAIVCEQSETETARALWSSLQSGLILPINETYKFFLTETEETLTTQNIAVPYRFLHDRVQQAAYSLVPEAERALAHYQIGQLLLQQISPAAREERIFELVNQLNYGTAFITQQKERDELAQLNLIACRKARSTTAYNAGREYANKGLSLLGENAWGRQYAMSLEFHELAAELAMLCGDLESMEQFIETVIARSRSLVEQINVYCIKIQASASQNKLAEAVTIGQGLLEQLGLTFPESPTPADIQQVIQEIDELIADREIADLVRLPEMSDRKIIGIVQIAKSIMAPAFLSGSPLYPLLVCFSVKFLIQYGNTSVSAYIYTNYGIILCNFLRAVDTAAQYGSLALQILAKLDAKASKPEVLLMLAVFLMHRKSHLKETLSLLQEGYATALEFGNLEFVGHNGHSFCQHSFVSGQPLETVEKESRAYCHEMTQLNQLTTATYARICWQATSNLLGLAPDPTCLTGEILQETELLPLLQSTRDESGLYTFNLYKMILCFWFGELDRAQNQALEVRRYFMAGAGLIHEASLYFYESLIALGKCDRDSDRTLEIVERATQNQMPLQQYWANHAPMNHQHKYDLVEAEKCRVLGKLYEAGDWYDRAIKGAKANCYIQEEALANELAAKFYLNWDKEKVAAGYMQEAYYCYAKWGAKAKVEDLVTRYPQLLSQILQRMQIGEQNSPLTTSSNTLVPLHQTVSSGSISISNLLDINTILKVAQSLYSEIHLEKLLATLMQVVVDNSGADKAALFLDRDGELQAVIKYVDRAILSFFPKPVDECQHLPTSVIHYVERTLETVTTDSKSYPSMASDRYFIKHQPQSLFCTPILNQGKLIGVLYLENAITNGAFTSERVELLKFLCSQAAISLKNATLYQQSQTYTQQLHDKSQQLEKTLAELQGMQVQLIQSEKMSALGNLVAGVAHEINNPVGCIIGNINVAQDYMSNLLDIIDLYQKTFPQPGLEIEEELEAIDIDYLRSDFPKLIEAMKDGGNRIKSISKSLRTFSRSDSEAKQLFNIHEGIDSTLLILRHRLKANSIRPAIEIVTNYGQVPEIFCFPGQLNQVFMNIIANAIDALEEFNAGRSLTEIQTHPNRITIETRLEGERANITIADNGPGIAVEFKNRIFEHLFTTKTVGKGTGLGLAIAWQIIVEKHGGAIDVTSEVGKGTEFILSLPVR